ncbi:MAG: hypothetical protein ABR562_06320, partial [Thermoplasmatota archaeon]
YWVLHVEGRSEFEVVQAPSPPPPPPPAPPPATNSTSTTSASPWLACDAMAPNTYIDASRHSMKMQLRHDDLRFGGFAWVEWQHLPWQDTRGANCGEPFAAFALHDGAATVRTLAPDGSNWTWRVSPSNTGLAVDGVPLGNGTRTFEKRRDWTASDGGRYAQRDLIDITALGPWPKADIGPSPTNGNMGFGRAGPASGFL